MKPENLCLSLVTRSLQESCRKNWIRLNRYSQHPSNFTLPDNVNGQSDSDDLYPSSQESNSSPSVCSNCTNSNELQTSASISQFSLVSPSFVLPDPQSLPPLASKPLFGGAFSVCSASA